MTETTASVLTPPGTGAIATIRVAGPDAWEVVRRHFRPAQGELPATPELHRIWFGTLGDEVVLAVKAANELDIHCHGGPRVVQWVIDLLDVPRADSRQAGALARASTLRTASILLDQYHGAFDRAMHSPTCEQLERLVALIPVGRHLVEPWRVVIAGPPNVGKSSLINALAGYERSIVSPTAGTTRDVVTVRVALDGWPVELSDTAGLRTTGEELEAAGIELAKRQLDRADLVVWVIDLTAPQLPPVGQRVDLLVGNKADLTPHTRSLTFPVLEVSAVTGAGIAGLISAVVDRLVPVAPLPGEAVPYLPEQIASVERLLHSGRGQPEPDA